MVLQCTVDDGVIKLPVGTSLTDGQSVLVTPVPQDRIPRSSLLDIPTVSLGQMLSEGDDLLSEMLEGRR